MLAGQHNNQKRDHQQHATGNDAAADPPAWRGQTPALQPVSVVWQHILQLSHAFSLGLLAQRGKRHCLTTRNGTQTVVRSNAQSNTNSTLRIVHCYVASKNNTPTRMCTVHKKSRSRNVMTPWSVDPNHWMIHLGWRKCMGVLRSSRAQLAATDTKSTFTAMVHAKMPHPSEWTFFIPLPLLSQPLEYPLTTLPPTWNRCGRVPQTAKPSANWRTKRVRGACAKMPEHNTTNSSPHGRMKQSRTILTALRAHCTPMRKTTQ